MGIPDGSHLHVCSREVAAVAQAGLFILAVFYTLYFARLFFQPLVLALLLSLLLAPLVSALNKIGIPDGLGAALIVLLLIGLLTGSVNLLIDPATEWIKRAPDTLSRVERKLRQFKKPVEQVRRASEEMEKLATMNGGEADVRMQGESLSNILLSNARNAAAGIAVTLALLYFLLASGDTFLRKLVRVLPRLEEKKRAVRIARKLKQDVSIYLFTITLINMGLGVAIGSAMYLLGMPNPLLWGVLATILNFIPYLGAMAGIAIIAAVAALTFDSPAKYIAPPLVYFLITATEGYFITPAVVGRRLTLNPVVILLGLVFWGWIWGIPGAVLSVPMLVSFKILCDYLPPLSPVGEFLGR